MGRSASLSINSVNFRKSDPHIAVVQVGHRIGLGGQPEFLRHWAETQAGQPFDPCWALETWTK